MKIKRILVSQPRPDSEKSPYFDLAEKNNVKIDFRLFSHVEGVPCKDFRKQRIDILNHTAVIFNSKTAIDHFFRICGELRIIVPDTMKYFCISESTAFYLQKYVQYRKRKIFHGKQNFADLIDIIRKHKGEKFLLPCSDIHKVSMSELLDSNEIDYTKAVIYKTVASNLSKLEIEKYDMLIFFSPSGIASLFKNFPDYQQNGVIIAAFGPTTSSAIVNAGLRLDLSAPTKTSPSMTMAIEEYILNESKKKK